MSTGTQITAEELARMPKDNFLYELVRGDLRQMSPAGARHGAIAMIIGAHLYQFVKQHNLGHVFAAETGFFIEADPDTVKAPDVSFVSLARLPIVPDEPAFLKMAPDLAIEVLSPNDREPEWTEKVNEWLAAGTQAVVVVDSRQRLAHVFLIHTPKSSLTESDFLELPDVVPGWVLPVRVMFE